MDGVAFSRRTQLIPFVILTRLNKFYNRFREASLAVDSWHLTYVNLWFNQIIFLHSSSSSSHPTYTICEYKNKKKSKIAPFPGIIFIFNSVTETKPIFSRFLQASVIFWHLLTKPNLTQLTMANYVFFCFQGCLDYCIRKRFCFFFFAERKTWKDSYSCVQKRWGKKKNWEKSANISLLWFE